MAIFGKNGDARLQTKGDTISEDRIVQVLRSQLDKKDCELLLIIGPMRSGTTITQILATQFQEINRVEFQPIKNIFRHGAVSFRDVICGEVILVKETLGPITSFECRLDPIDLLHRAGVSYSKIRAIFMLRNPKDVYKSTLRFVEDFNLDLLKIIQGRVVELYSKYKDRLTVCVPFCYDLAKMDSELAYKSLFSRCGIDVSEISLDFNCKLLKSKTRWNEAESAYYFNNVIVPMLKRGGFKFVEDSSSSDVSDDFLELCCEFENWKEITKGSLKLKR